MKIENEKNQILLDQENNFSNESENENDFVQEKKIISKEKVMEILKKKESKEIGLFFQNI
jgi:hypothetical protein